MGRAVVGLGRAMLACVLVAPPSVDAQPRESPRRIGYLAGGSGTVSAVNVDAFRDALRDLGWIEGRNLSIEYRFADGRAERLPDLAAELVRLKVDLILAVPTPAALAARDATATIPIVMVSVADPVAVGLVESLARPGRNATGVSFSVGIDIIGKELQVLKDAVPRARTVAILLNPTNPGHAHAVTNAQAAARSLGLSLWLVEARAPADLDGAFATMARDRADALLVIADAMFHAQRVRIAELASKRRLPSMHAFREYVDAGGLMSYGPNLVSQYRQAAGYVDRILKGAKPAELPVEQPTKFELVINLRTARALGLSLPQSLLLQADQLIE